MSVCSTIDHLQALPSGYQLQEYTITGALGHGGFGITYAAHDKHLDTLVAIKEYLPSDKAVRLDGCTVSAKSARDKVDFEWGLKRFLNEAQTLARFDHPNIVKVFRFFEANGTGYMVMEYVEGRTLACVLNQVGTLPEQQIRHWLWPIMQGLETVHAAGYLHRDIKPQNIMIRKDGRPVLLDFGAARMTSGDRSIALTAIMTPGFAPLEQYQTSGEQGPWTDIYALGAVLHCCITGSKPADVMDRVSNDNVKANLSAYTNRYSEALLKGTSAALSMTTSNRPRELSTWRQMLEGQVEADTVEIPIPLAHATPDLQTRIQPALLQPNVATETIGAAQRRLSLPKSLVAAVVFSVLIGVPAWFYWSASDPTVSNTPKGEALVAEAPGPEPKPAAISNQVESEPSTGPVVAEPEANLTAAVEPAVLEPHESDVETPREIASEPSIEIAAETTTVAQQPEQPAYQAPREAVVQSTAPMPAPEFALTVRTQPEDASVRILNIQPRYAPGMTLSPGSYHIEVSRDGYLTQRTWAAVADEDTEVSVTLNPSSYPLVVDTVPQDATVRILNAEHDYKPGVLLPPGNYHVEVSKAGFVTEHERVLIVDRAQFPSIALTPMTPEATAEPVELSAAAQRCALPTRPPQIAAVAGYDELVKAKTHIDRFQKELVVYRDCLDATGLLPEQTNGNLIALNNAHNDSVDLEEQVASAFNVALRNYRDRSDQALAKQ